MNNSNEKYENYSLTAYSVYQERRLLQYGVGVSRTIALFGAQSASNSDSCNIVSTLYTHRPTVLTVVRRPQPHGYFVHTDEKPERNSQSLHHSQDEPMNTSQWTFSN